jgi:hypothetical protein
MAVVLQVMVQSYSQGIGVISTDLNLLTLGLQSEPVLRTFDDLKDEFIGLLRNNTFS